MKLRKRSRALALRAVAVLTAFVLLAIFLRVIRVEFLSSSVQISSAGFQVVVSWGSSKPMVADESENAEVFVEGAPHSDDNPEDFFSVGDSIYIIHAPAGNIGEIDAGTLLTYGTVDALNWVTKEVDSYGYGIAFSPYLMTYTTNVNIASAGVVDVVDFAAFPAGVTCANSVFAAEVSSLQTVRDHRDNCRTPTGHNGLVNRISLGVGEIGGFSLAWTPSPVSDTLEQLECRLGQLLSLFTDRSAKERLTSSVVVQQNQDAPPIFLIGGVLFPPSFVPAFFLWIQPAVFSSPLIVFAILKIPILGLLHDTSTSSDLDGVVPRPGALSA